MLSAAALFENASNRLDHNRLLSLINSMSDGFLALDSAGKIELSNGVALNLLDTNSLVDKNVRESMPLTDGSGKLHNLLDLVYGGSAFASRDYGLKYADGSFVSLFINSSPVRSGFGAGQSGGYVVTFRDITREKQAEDERDEFISVASHELRNPAAIAEGSISNALMLAEKTGASDNLKQVLNSAHEQIIFLSGLINDLSMVSRADRLRFEQTAADFSPAEVINELVKDYGAQASKKGLSLTVRPVQLPVIRGSRLYTREILQNFITNAIKYSQKGEIVINSAIQNGSMNISVSDTGFGISPQDQQKMFGKFFRSEDTRVRNINGTGLGLYISAKLAKLMGGNIFLKSELNHGSTFTLSLPLKSPEAVAKT